MSFPSKSLRKSANRIIWELLQYSSNGSKPAHNMKAESSRHLWSQNPTCPFPYYGTANRRAAKNHRRTSILRASRRVSSSLRPLFRSCSHPNCSSYSKLKSLRATHPVRIQCLQRSSPRYVTITCLSLRNTAYLASLT